MRRCDSDREAQSGLLHAGERLDDLERGGLWIIQDPKKFRFGLDAVLLAYFARIKRSQSVLDLGTGTGILPLLLYGRYAPRRIVGIEIQPDMADMARRSVAYNGLSERIEIRCGDFKEEGALGRSERFDAVLANPPYFPVPQGKANASAAHSIARHEITATLEEFVHAAAGHLGTGGKLFLVHQPKACARLFRALTQERMEPKRMRLVQATEEKEPSLLLVEAAKQGGEGLQMERTLILYTRDGRYTREAAEIYGR